MKNPSSASLFFFVFLFACLSVFSLLSSGPDLLLLGAKLVWSLIISILGLLMMREGLIAKYRSILFVLIALFFFLEFKLFRYFGLTQAIPPYCHIAEAPTLANFFHSQFLAFTSGAWRLWGVLTMGFLWLLIMFTIGQGICSWVCFYGGIDEAFSKLAKKPLIKARVPAGWRDFPLAFLIFLLILSFLQGSAVFCSWFCPLKMTGALCDSAPMTRAVQLSFFAFFLSIFLIVLPVLTKKRTFCSFICPFGALVSVCGRVSPYQVVIEEPTCIRCGKCLEVCPVFAVEHGDTYKISSYCNKCGACVDVCPVDAIHVTAMGRRLAIVRPIFIFLSLLLTGVISGSFVPRFMLHLVGLK